MVDKRSLGGLIFSEIAVADSGSGNGRKRTDQIGKNADGRAWFEGMSLLLSLLVDGVLNWACRSENYRK